MLAPIGMTFHTILEIGDAFFQMLSAYIGLGMLVTSIAGVGGIVDRMARDARDSSTLAVIHREGVLPGELSGSPCGGTVADGALRTKLAQMFGWLGMAGNTTRPQPRKLTVRVATLTSQIHMRAGQREV